MYLSVKWLAVGGEMLYELLHLVRKNCQLRTEVAHKLACLITFGREILDSIHTIYHNGSQRLRGISDCSRYMAKKRSTKALCGG
jgi:hypothetical protein